MKYLNVIFILIQTSSSQQICPIFDNVPANVSGLIDAMTVIKIPPFQSFWIKQDIVVSIDLGNSSFYNITHTCELENDKTYEDYLLDSSLSSSRTRTIIAKIKADLTSDIDAGDITPEEVASIIEPLYSENDQPTQINLLSPDKEPSDENKSQVMIKTASKIDLKPEEYKRAVFDQLEELPEAAVSAQTHYRREERLSLGVPRNERRRYRRDLSSDYLSEEIERYDRAMKLIESRKESLGKSVTDLSILLGVGVISLGGRRTLECARFGNIESTLKCLSFNFENISQDSKSSLLLNYLAEMLNKRFLYKIESRLLKDLSDKHQLLKESQYAIRQKMSDLITQRMRRRMNVTSHNTQ